MVESEFHLPFALLSDADLAFARASGWVGLAAHADDQGGAQDADGRAETF